MDARQDLVEALLELIDQAMANDPVHLTYKNVVGALEVIKKELGRVKDATPEQEKIIKAVREVVREGFGKNPEGAGEGHAEDITDRDCLQLWEDWKEYDLEFSEALAAEHGIEQK